MKGPVEDRSISLVFFLLPDPSPFFPPSCSGGDPSSILKGLYEGRRRYHRVTAAILPQRAVVRVTEIIRSIIRLLLEALHSLSIWVFMLILEGATPRPRSARPPSRRRQAFDNYPPSAWAAP